MQTCSFVVTFMAIGGRSWSFVDIKVF